MKKSKLRNITLDTSCMDKSSLRLLHKLKNLEKQDIIDIQHNVYAEIETNRWISDDKSKVQKTVNEVSKAILTAASIPLEAQKNSEKTVEYLEKHRGYSVNQLIKIESRVLNVLFPQGFHKNDIKSDYIDIRMLSEHIAGKRDIFVTKNKKHFITGGRKEKLEQEFPGLKIRFLNEELIEELKSD